MIILLILITYLLTVYGYCLEKFDLGPLLGLKGLSNESTVVGVTSTHCTLIPKTGRAERRILDR